MEILYQFNVFIRAVILTFLLSTLIQFLFYSLIGMRVVFRKKKTKKESTEPVSVIICARDECINLSENLPLVLEQNYPDYEVVVVNDCSEDDTEILLAQLKNKYPRLRSTIIKKSGSFANGKKFAATVGVKAANYKWMLFTDADCKPASPDWIREMSGHFVPKKDIVLGYGGYIQKPGYLNKWIRYDACFTALQYFGFALAGMPYMGAGKNLAYRKSLFYNHNGFAAHAHILSGSNDLFVNQAATRKNVDVEYSIDAHTRSVPQKTFREWFRQKRWHVSTGKYYKSKHAFWLCIEPLSRVLFWIAFCVLMVQNIWWQYTLGVFLFRMVVFLSVFGAAAKKFNERGLRVHAGYFDMIMPFMYIYVYILNNLSRPNRWK